MLSTGLLVETISKRYSNRFLVLSETIEESQNFSETLLFDNQQVKTITVTVVILLTHDKANQRKPKILVVS
jgi:hypothetical protein